MRRPEVSTSGDSMPERLENVLRVFRSFDEAATWLGFPAGTPDPFA